MYRKYKSINLKKIYIRFTYFMFYLVKVSPILRVTSATSLSKTKIISLKTIVNILKK
jgi:hypothetical protein